MLRNREHVWSLFRNDGTFFAGSVEYQFFLECSLNSGINLHLCGLTTSTYPYQLNVKILDSWNQFNINSMVKFDKYRNGRCH